ncbi:sulfite exporter TauE/SafE family protein [Solidesulfovibrio magneticus]|uniref:Probable membrane transporter protein n=1 Tax=Solidesulfovibrio magneticus (strain ATCC 700980 / DSM 13731 / RS-1) TaxID=573370 RepID=C4XR04_SOLM1|nr:sulfite exporter TauE/SafE family protein [Solidesulfovibrio magneticus]BAH77884.1 hypothetical membrane protein [Solidesulfovibrio magneticus RS-1]
MYFPTAGIETALWLPPVVAFAISFFTSMGGVSGAFLLLPFQMSFLGYAHPSVSATNQLFNIVAIPSGVYRYVKEGRMVWPLTWMVIVGTLPGVLIGAVVRVAWLPDPRDFKLFVGLVMLYIGARMVKSLFFSSADKDAAAANEKRFQAMARRQGRQDADSPAPSVRVLSFTVKHLSYSFYEETYTVSTIGIFSLCFIVGIVGGIYGIGGGSIVAPFFISFWKLPVYTVAGAALMGTFVTSVAGVAFYQVLAPFYPTMSVAPDWMLGLLFGLGGMGGMYLGARCQKFVPSKYIKLFLVAVLLYTGIKYTVDFLR